MKTIQVILLRLVILLILSLFTIGRNFHTSVITTKANNLKCENINPKIYDTKFNCSMKPLRNGKSVTNVRYFFGKPANDVWAHIKVFYRFPTNTQFKPWMIEFDVDICENVKNLNALSGFAFFFARSFVKNAPSLLHPCPYIGDEGLKDADIDAILADTIPQIVPRGWYKMLGRFHTKENRTFFQVILTVHVDAKDPMKAYDMGS